MPQYIMKGESSPEFGRLDYFVQGYIKAAFWTSEEPNTTTDPEMVDDYTRLWEPENESPLPGDVGFDDIAPESLANIIAECAKFQEENAADLEIAYTGEHANGMAYESESAGHDFWLTRNGHGVGFWDRATSTSPAEWAEAMDRLSDAAKAYGESDWYLGDDGQVWAT